MIHKQCNKPHNSKCQGPTGCILTFCQMWKKEITPELLKLLQEIEKLVTFPKLFHKVNPTLLIKLDKNTMGKKKTSLIKFNLSS